MHGNTQLNDGICSRMVRMKHFMSVDAVIYGFYIAVKGSYRLFGKFIMFFYSAFQDIIILML